MAVINAGLRRALTMTLGGAGGGAGGVFKKGPQGERQVSNPEQAK